MSKALGPVLATGFATMANQSFFNNKPIDWRVPIATGLAGVGFVMMEKAWPDGAQMLAWTMFLTVMLTRTNPSVPSPTESALQWWQNSKGN